MWQGEICLIKKWMITGTTRRRVKNYQYIMKQMDENSVVDILVKGENNNSAMPRARVTDKRAKDEQIQARTQARQPKLCCPAGGGVPEYHHLNCESGRQSLSKDQTSTMYHQAHSDTGSITKGSLAKW